MTNDEVVSRLLPMLRAHTAQLAVAATPELMVRSRAEFDQLLAAIRAAGLDDVRAGALLLLHLSAGRDPVSQWCLLDALLDP